MEANIDYCGQVMWALAMEATKQDEAEERATEEPTS